MNWCMGTSDVKAIVEQVEQLLAEEELSERTELAIHKLGFFAQPPKKSIRANQELARLLPAASSSR